MKLFDNKNECCGCWACANICPKGAITMTPDNEGFKYPGIDSDKCIDCHLCEKACPIKVSKAINEAENNKKHIGIINLQSTNNYGASIAAAVLEDVVRNIVGDEYVVQTVNYYPKKDFPHKWDALRDEAKQWGGWKHYLRVAFPTKKPAQKPSLRSNHFKIFNDNFMNLTPLIHNAYSINKDVFYSAFITGSDIVWGVKRTDDWRSEGYYLKFANRGEKRIAYAPSLDNKVDDSLIALSDCYRENLKNLDCISVRERSSIDFVQGLTDKKVYHCCDPAFLVEPEYYDKMLSTADVEKNDDKYIYVYILEVNHQMVKYANKLAEEKDLKIYYFSRNHSDYPSDAVNCADDGPAEFLYRLRHAEYVLTNSFHCVVFSILFEKKFLSFFRSEISVKSTDLLQDFDLMQRLITDDKECNIDDDIDFTAVKKKLNEIRKSSLNYLKNALSDIK